LREVEWGEWEAGQCELAGCSRTLAAPLVYRNVSMFRKTICENQLCILEAAIHFHQLIKSRITNSWLSYRA
jgi:hypothetical protein